MIEKNEAVRSEDVVICYKNEWYCIPFIMLATLPAVVNEYAISQLNLFHPPLVAREEGSGKGFPQVTVGGLPFSIWKRHMTDQIHYYWRSTNHSAISNVKNLISRNPAQFKSVLLSCKVH